MLFAEAGVSRSYAFLLSESRSRLRTEGEDKIESLMLNLHLHNVKDDLFLYLTKFDVVIFLRSPQNVFECPVQQMPNKSLRL